MAKFFIGAARPVFLRCRSQEPSHNLKAISGLVTYGWGVIPVQVRIGKTEWRTSLFPKEGRYLVPIKASVQKAEDLYEGDNVTVRLVVNL